jgi:hypothetical protein
MSAADDAYRAAQEEIAIVKNTGGRRLHLIANKFRMLDRLPEEVADLTELTLIDLSKTRVSDLRPLSGMKALSRLWLDDTPVSDLSPLARMTGEWHERKFSLPIFESLRGIFWTGLSELSLSGTQVRDLSALSGLRGLERLDLDRTQVSDLRPLSQLLNLQTVSISDTPVSDLRPLMLLRQLMDAPIEDGLQFIGCAAAMQDKRIAQIAAFKRPKQRARELFAYLGKLEAEGAIDEKLPSRALPHRRPAPLEVMVTDTAIAMAGSQGLPRSDANARAEMGWDALRRFRQDFSGSFNISNYSPLPSYLAAFDREMGEVYDPRRVVAIGMQGQRIIALSTDGDFVARLPDGAGSDLKAFAAAITTYVNRFPDWVEYRDEADPDDVSPAAVRAAERDFGEVRDILQAEPRAEDAVKQEYAAEVADGTDAKAGEPEAKGLVASTGEIARALAEREVERRKQQKRNREDARLGGDFYDKTVRGPLGLPKHLLLKAEKPLRSLARRFPNRMGWLELWYDETFGPENTRGD